MDDPKLVRMLTPVLGGFEANISIKTPGRLLEANTTRRTLKKAIWSFDFNRDAKAFRDFYNKDLVAIFDGDGLSLPAE